MSMHGSYMVLNEYGYPTTGKPVPGPVDKLFPGQKISFRSELFGGGVASSLKPGDYHIHCDHCDTTLRVFGPNESRQEFNYYFEVVGDDPAVVNEVIHTLIHRYGGVVDLDWKHVTKKPLLPALNSRWKRLAFLWNYLMNGQA